MTYLRRSATVGIISIEADSDNQAIMRIKDEVWSWGVGRSEGEFASFARELAEALALVDGRFSVVPNK